MADTVSVSDEILAAIKYALERQTLKYDQTYKSKILGTYSNGTYTVRDQSGANRTVKCGIPNVELTTGTSVWVTVPCGNIRNSFISGVA